MKYRTDLILGEAFCIFIFFYFIDSGLSVMVCNFIFDCVTVKTENYRHFEEAYSPLTNCYQVCYNYYWNCCELVSILAFYQVIMIEDS